MITALTFLILTGISWNIVGVVVGMLGRKGLSTTWYLVFVGAMGIAADLVIALFAPEKVLPPAGTLPAAWVSVAVVSAVGGALNCCMIQLMGIAMKKGPNSVVWAIIQSGCVYPFLMAWLVFGEALTFARAAGIILIIASIVLYAARGKAGGNPSAKSGTERLPISAWFLPALLGMLFCGLGQCGGNLPSYIDGGQDVPSVFRHMMSSFGNLSFCLFRTLIRRLRGCPVRKPFPGELRATALYTLLAVGVSYPASAFLQYNGLDKLKNLGAGSMGYPTMVATCIISFFPYGLIVLHEKINRLQALGAAVGVAGIIIGCMQ